MMSFCVAAPIRYVTRLTAGFALVACAVFALSSCSSDSMDTAGGAPMPSGDADNDSPADPNNPPSTPNVPNPSQPGTNPDNLGPLPNPPFTPAPGPDSEPLVSSMPISTISQSPFLIDPPRKLVDTTGELTDADFDAGPPPAVILIPDDFDPTGNEPPFFDNISNAEGFAGQELTARFKPRDPEGDLPGMFKGSLPEGAKFEDNFDGSKSLVWTPLQPDVGIHEFTVTATDPDEPFYRTQQTIRIRVNLPSDTSTIENKPPQVNRIRPHTVKVNDPVVLYIKVSDPNGTIPRLEVLTPPTGSTLTPHPIEQDVSILHWIPQSPGAVFVQLKAIDVDDASLSDERSVIIDVLPEDVFIRPGTRLRELADARDFLIGFAALQNYYERPDGALYAQTAAEEFNVVTTEISLKWDYINPVPGKFRWAATDNLLRYANLNQIIVHGHTLVWHRQLPKWVQLSAPADREIMMREFIDRLLKRYAGEIPLWHVVNEALEEDGTFRQSLWHEAMAADYIDIAFKQAKLSAPTATLIYNDYDIAFEGPKSRAMLGLMQSLKDRNVPVDGVGFQLHLFADFDRWDEVEANFQRVADMDLDIYMTEIDISLENDEQTLAQQAQAYERLLSICLAQPRCKSMQTWGFTDQYSWRRGLDPLLLDDRYQAKPSYLAVQQRLLEN